MRKRRERSKVVAVRGNALSSTTKPARAVPDNGQAAWPQANSRWWPELLLLTPTLLFAFARVCFLATDPDYWWHARTGQYIVERGAIPRADIFSYTMNGQPWVAHEWLTEVVLYLVERTVGYGGNVVLFGLIGALTSLAVYATCRLRGLDRAGAALLTTWGAVMALPLVNVRPQMLTALLLAVFALILTRYQQGHGERALWMLPPLLALWVNLHGGYIIGVALLGLTVAGEIFARLRRQTCAPLRPLLLVTVLSVAATLLSPHGLDALRYPFTYAGSGNASQRYIAEWQSPDFHQPVFLVFAASLLLGLVLGLGRAPLGPTAIVWATGFTLLGLQSIRHIPLYAIVVLPLIGARLQAEWPRLPRRLAGWSRALGQTLALVLPLALAALALTRSDDRHFSWAPSATGYPAGAVAYLRDTAPAGNLFHEYHWGGYLLYELYPQRQVFIDGRADVYGDAFVERFRTVTQLRPGWREVLADYDVRLILVEKDSPLAVVLRDDPAWREIYSGAIERLFARETP